LCDNYSQDFEYEKAHSCGNDVVLLKSLFELLSQNFLED